MVQKHALLIANSKYNDKTFKELMAPQVDVKAFAKVLLEPTIGGFSSAETLIDQPLSATTQKIESFFLKKDADLMLLYFSGHGLLDEWGHFSVVVRDTVRRLLTSTSISDEFIMRLMNYNFSPQQVLILDCCYSGAFGHGAKGESSGGEHVAEQIGRNAKGKVILTATGAEYEAWEEIRGNRKLRMSYFTRYLVRGLETGEADSNNKGVISIDDLYNYAQRKVIELRPTQTPGRSYDQVRGDIIIARNPKWIVPPSNVESSIVVLQRNKLSISRRIKPNLRVSRRTILVGLAALMMVGSGSVALEIVLNISKFRTYRTYRGFTKRINTVAWSPDSTSIAIGSGDTKGNGMIQVRNVIVDSLISQYQGDFLYVQSIAWSPDGQRIAVAGFGEPVQTWNADDRSHIIKYNPNIIGAAAVAWSPDGNNLAVADSYQKVQIWNATKGSLLSNCIGPTNFLTSIAWSSDSQFVVAGSQDGNAYVWDSLSGGEATVIYRNHAGMVLTVAWSHDGTYIASGGEDRTVQVWDAPNGGNVFTYRGHSDWVETVAWSPDYTLIASGGRDKTVQVWWAP
jgi:hypothetical protein